MIGGMKNGRTGTVDEKYPQRNKTSAGNFVWGPSGKIPHDFHQKAKGWADGFRGTRLKNTLGRTDKKI